MDHLPERKDRRPWTRGALLAVWSAVTLFWVQFALASAQELEPQAAIVGWMLVAICVGAGLALLGAAQLNRPLD